MKFLVLSSVIFLLFMVQSVQSQTSMPTTIPAICMHENELLQIIKENGKILISGFDKGSGEISIIFLDTKTGSLITAIVIKPMACVTDVIEFPEYDKDLKPFFDKKSKI